MKKIKPVLAWIRDRSREPSTWAALVPLFGYLGWEINEADGAKIGAGIGVLLGIILKEKAQ